MVVCGRLHQDAHDVDAHRHMLHIMYVLPDAAVNERYQHGRLYQAVPMGNLHHSGVQLLLCHLGHPIHVGEDDSTAKP